MGEIMKPNRESLCRGIVAAAILFCLAPVHALAQCDSPWFEVAYNGGTVSHIGHAVVSGDTVMSRGGNTFVLDCDAQLGSISVRVHRPSVPNRDIQPLAVGDRLRCEILDADRNLIMEDIQPFPDLGLIANVGFLFWDNEFQLSAGQYYFMVSTVDPAYAYLNWGEEYADGQYQQDYLGFWTPYPARDAVFKVYLDPESTLVPAVQQSFGGIKALYR